MKSSQVAAFCKFCALCSCTARPHWWFAQHGCRGRCSPARRQLHAGSAPCLHGMQRLSRSAGPHRRVAQHADVEVGVAQPGSSFLQVLHGAQDDLCVEVVGHRADVLALNRQLLVQQAQVVLQLRAACSAPSQSAELTSTLCACELRMLVQTSSRQRQINTTMPARRRRTSIWLLQACLVERNTGQSCEEWLTLPYNLLQLQLQQQQGRDR